MALVNLDGVPVTQVGFPTRGGMMIGVGSSNAALLDATNEAIIMVGQIWTSDGGSHTIDTTGSSSVGFRTNNVTFINAGTTVKAGLAAADTANGPPGRAVNVGGVITFNVSRSMAGGSGQITANSWIECAPDNGTMTIANGDLVALGIQMTAQGAADLINISGVAQPTGNLGFPCVTSYTSGTYNNGVSIPGARIRFSDGARGYFSSSAIQNGNLVTTTWNSGSATKEYGNSLSFPFPVRIHGVVGSFAIGGPVDFVLYSNPFVTPVAERTVSLSQRNVATLSSSAIHMLFPVPYDATANQPLVIAAKPGATSISAYTRLVANISDQDGDSGGESCFGVSRATGFFSPLSLERYSIGVTVQAFAHPARSSHIMGL